MLPPEQQADRERERLRRKNRERRAAMRGAQSEPYTLQEIAARDRNRCGLCGDRVAVVRPYPWPDLRSPVIDHVIPLARGGSNLRSNVQLAHFGCNASKGAAGGGEQLALIG